jgi:superfamily II DNA or RNA helicase
MSAAAENLLDRIIPIVRQRLPVDIGGAYLNGFLARNRPLLVSLIERHLGALLGAQADRAPLAELWTPGKRTAANLAAMRTLADRAPADLTEADLSVLRGYSGWGGLSIRDAAARFPPGFPVPEERGLIHEYYTPTRVAEAVADAIAPLLDSLPEEEGVIHALEPSAGIGRFLHAFDADEFSALSWQVCEWSEVSGRFLRVLFPDVALHVGPFERWVREQGPIWSQRLGLVVSNPPYGARGASIAEDPDRAYREKMAYHYFMRRALDMLAPGGLGVFLVPAGFLTGRSVVMRGLREKVLQRHHLSAAYRLPSMRANGREALFPGAMLVTDLLFFRSRGGRLDAVDPDDQFIAEGRYFDEFPGHILGQVVGADRGEDDQTATPRYRYQIQGEFTGLPELVERPICAECRVINYPSAAAGGKRVGVTRQITSDVTDLPRDLAAAVGLGLRVDRYLSLLASDRSEEPPLLWPELVEALRGWVTHNGTPAGNVELVKLARGGNTGAERFLSAFDRMGQLIAGLRTAPPVYEPRFAGRADDIVAIAEHLYRNARSLRLTELLMYHADMGGRLTPVAVREALVAAGWCFDGDDGNELIPAEVYLTGDLWPRYDRAVARGQTEQARRLLAAIAPAVFDDIDGVSARQGWVPLDLVDEWINETWSRFLGFEDVSLQRVNGLVAPVGWEYEDLSKKERDLHPEVLLLVGWMNHDKTLFSPPKSADDDSEKDVDRARVKRAEQWDAAFKGWAGATLARRLRIEAAYNRQFRGFVQPRFDAEHLPIARWRKDGPRLHPHQVAGARRILENRGGLLAFDVGVGKTYTGIGVIARARQDGWCRRPVVVVPNSIIWKWHADFARVLPDYRVAVIGSKKKTISRGDRKGLVTSETDTPQERAEKWTRFQAGEYDVVLLSYTALGRTRMNEDAVRSYAEKTEAIQREVTLRRRNAQRRKKLSERDQAILQEGVAAWVAQQMEIAEGWEYDPGVAWDDIGVDLLMVDEAQNFKNLYLPEEREGGVPRFMGNPGDGSKRAWQLDFRCAAVRRKTGGAGVVLLSATPAKNSPLEFYNLIQYVDPTAWTRMGIRDPEQFIDRYLKIELKSVVTAAMEVEERGAVVGFQNLHELRDVILRYGEFKTAEDVGLRLPEPRVEMVEVDMDGAQDAKYDDYVRQIEAAIKSDDPGERAQILGLLARMALVAIHAELDDGYSWKTADQVEDPASPKFEALAARVLDNRTCGHIVFVDNVAAHRWVRDVLVKGGIAADRIAVLNAEVAPNAADRQRIAREFNGDPETETAPKYDVVIANAIAYEGIDLQTRTCAIHHLDLPWEPATLQQRNGRGVRQGNTLSAIAIYYYFSRRSQDGLRFNLIQGKRGWMTQLLKSQDRDTNNPGAQMSMGPEEILLLISRDPEKTRIRLEAVRASREAEARKKIANEASKMLRAVNSRFRNAERSRDPVEAARLRGEGEERLKQLARVSPEAWPWAAYSVVVRERAVLVPDGGGPLYEGLRIGVPSAWNPNRVDFIEFGRVGRDGAMGLREAGAASWRTVRSDDTTVRSLHPANYAFDWPTDEAEATLRTIRERLDRNTRLTGDWRGLGWQHAPDAWVEGVWNELGGEVIEALGAVPFFQASDQRLPIATPDGLQVVKAATLRGNRAASPYPPTDAGWRAFLAAGPDSGLSFSDLAAAGQYWWGRSIPRTLLSAGRNAEEEDAEVVDFAQAAK